MKIPKKVNLERNIACDFFIILFCFASAGQIHYISPEILQRKKIKKNSTSLLGIINLLNSTLYKRGDKPSQADITSLLKAMLVPSYQKEKGNRPKVTATEVFL